MSSDRIVGAMDPPPPGEVANFDDPFTLAHENIALHSTGLAIVTTLMIIRMYTRIKIQRLWLGADDYFAISSYCLQICYAAFMFRGGERGLGRHIWDVPATWLPDAIMYLRYASYAYFLLSGSIKLVILFFYHRIFSVNRQLKLWINFGIIFTILSTLSLFFVNVFSCRPLSYAWDRSIPGGHCLDSVPIAWSSAAWSSATDIYILVLPMPTLFSLNMDLNRKMKLVVVFGLGLVACIASLVRLGMTRNLMGSWDATYDTSAIGRWSVVEVDTGMICACLPLLPAFINHVFPGSLKTWLSQSWSRGTGSIFRRTKASNSAVKSNNSWRTSQHPASSDQALVEMRAPYTTLENADDIGDYKIQIQKGVKVETEITVTQSDSTSRAVLDDPELGSYRNVQGHRMG